MPIYEYRCEKGHTFEVMQRIGDDPASSCEVCGKPVKRVFHPIAVHFKGKGFYNTDYGTRSRQRELAKSASEGKSDSGSAGKDSGEKTSEKSGDKADKGGAGSSPEKAAPAADAKKSKPAASAKKSSD